MGDYDRLGRRIAWAATDDPVYASAVRRSGARPLVVRRHRQASPRASTWSPGTRSSRPRTSTENGETLYGSYTVVNAWPQKLSEQRTLYLNQFTGQTITNATAAQDGALSRLTSFGIAMHMGNQFGLLTRILATFACLGCSTSALTGLLMWWNRRPSGRSWIARSGGAAHPRRYAEACGHRGVRGRVVLGVLFPVFGVSLLVVLALETVLARRIGRAAPSPTTRSRWLRCGRAACRRSADEQPPGAPRLTGLVGGRSYTRDAWQTRE